MGFTPNDVTKGLNDLSDYLSNAPQETLERLDTIENMIINLAKVLLNEQQYKEWANSVIGAAPKVSEQDSDDMATSNQNQQ